jgi:hypothetical protein
MCEKVKQVWEKVPSVRRKSGVGKSYGCEEVKQGGSRLRR